MKIALAILSQIRRGQKTEAQDRFELRLRSMTSPATTGPRLRRMSTPVLFRRGGAMA